MPRGNIHELDIITSADELREWQERAACRDIGFELWFPEDYSGEADKKAQQICLTRCHVRAQCLAYAIKTYTEHGIWGGVRGNELLNIAKRRRAAELEASPAAAGADPLALEGIVIDSVIVDPSLEMPADELDQLIAEADALNLGDE